MRLLLDTCTFLWRSAQPERLSASAAAALEDPNHDLFLSDVSIWEISLKYGLGKLPLPDPPRIWIPRQIQFLGLDSAPVTHNAIYLSGELPLIHRDPFDRLLAAVAIGQSLQLMTPDPWFDQLGVDRLW